MATLQGGLQLDLPRGPERELVELSEQIDGVRLTERAIRLAERRGGN